MKVIACFVVVFIVGWAVYEVTFQLILWAWDLAEIIKRFNKRLFEKTSRAVKSLIAFCKSIRKKGVDE